MRKVLLATTALATATGFAAVANAEFTLSGWTEVSYENVSDDNAANASASEARVNNTATLSFSSSTDNGLTFGMWTYLGDASGSEASISGDFGKVKFCDGSTGGACGAAGDYDITSVGIAGGHGDQLFTLLPASGTTGVSAVEIDEAQIDDSTDTGGMTFEYHSPSFNGFAFGVSTSHLKKSDDNTSMGMGASYSGSAGDISYKIGVASYDGTANNAEGNHVGANVTMGDMTFGIGSASNKTSSTSKKKTLSYSVNYAMSDDITINIGRTDSENDGAAAASDDTEASNTTIGVRYSVAPGLAVSLASHSFEYKSGGSVANDGNAIVSQIQMYW